jgi:hypothetical protein
MATTLAQLLAVEKGIRQDDHDATTELYKGLQRTGAFSGETRKYRVLTVDSTGKPAGIAQPDKQVNITANTKDYLDLFRECRARTIDVILTKDLANRGASADLVVDGVTLATGMPSVTLLSLEKTADDIVAFIKALPTLDPTEKWTYDENVGCYRSEPAKTLSTSKETVPLILWQPDDPATSKHGPVTDKVQKDVPVGEWTVTKFSSAIPAGRKQVLLARAAKFREAVKYAREKANYAPVTDAHAGKTIFDWLFAE